MKIQKLVIEDFQSHENSFIEFDSNITAITGLNNHGKSAILKALRKIIRNDPNGNIFIRNLPQQQPHTRIEILTDRSNKVERKVGHNLSNSSLNMYKVEFNTGEKFEFTKFARTGIPEEVLTALDISIPQLFGNVSIDLNFHIQQDNIFLIKGDGLSSLRSKVLSKITGVDVAQRAIQIGNAREKSFNQDLNKERIQRQSYQLELEKYACLDDVIGDVNDSLIKLTEINELKNRVEYFSSSFFKISDILNSAYKYNNIVKCLQVSFDVNNLINIATIMPLLKKLQVISSRIETVKKLNKYVSKKINIEKIDNAFKLLHLCKTCLTLKNKMDKLNSVLNISIINTNSISKLDNDRLACIVFKQNADSYKDGIQCRENDIINLNEYLEKKEKELMDLKIKLKVCPTCNRPFEACNRPLEEAL